jgi:hypothetical protein
MSAGHKWRPLQRAVRKPASDRLIEIAMQYYGVERDAAVLLLEKELENVETWRNDLYQVEVRRNPEERAAHLNIRRTDGFPGRDWRHFQQIKNELIGPECEAIELYPAESRKVDTSNKYHLYCSTDPTFRFPVGWEKRDVRDDEGDTQPGLRQRPAMKVQRATSPISKSEQDAIDDGLVQP